MEITIYTCLLTKWYMDIDSRHIDLLIQLKTKYDYNSILISIFIISLLLIYYKNRSPFFFKKYFNLNHIIYMGNKEDFFYRDSLFSFQNIFPIFIYSIVMSFFYGFIITDSKNSLFSVFENIHFLRLLFFLSTFIFLFSYTRILVIHLLFFFNKFSNKFKKIYTINFIRLTLNISFLAISFSFLSYLLLPFKYAFMIYIVSKLILVFLRPLMLYNFSMKVESGKKLKIIFLILLSDILPSIIFFDSMNFLKYFEIILNYFN